MKRANVLTRWEIRSLLARWSRFFATVASNNDRAAKRKNSWHNFPVFPRELQLSRYVARTFYSHNDYTRARYIYSLRESHARARDSLRRDKFRDFRISRFRNVESALSHWRATSESSEAGGETHGFGRVLFSFYITAHNTARVCTAKRCVGFTECHAHVRENWIRNVEVRRGAWSIHAQSLPPREASARLEKWEGVACTRYLFPA